METTTIKVESRIAANPDKVWNYYTDPEHIIKWNFADSSWHCPSATNDLQVGGKYFARMEAKDGSFGFDYEASYYEVTYGESLSYTLTDGRKVIVVFNEDGDHTNLIIEFEAETENSLDMQKGGWQSILNNFKNYVEQN